MENALSIALEALGRVESQEISIHSAASKAAQHLGVTDKTVIAQARLLVRNVLYRKNFIDKVLDLALTPLSRKTFNRATHSFLRIFVFKTMFTHQSPEEAVSLAKAGRSILGWKNLLPVEEALGKMEALLIG